LDVAKTFRNEEKMFFPHNMDFRGRVYPIPPHLNHMGSDICRGLLIFSDGKPLGKRGLYWLKVQLSNLAGHDKISLEKRKEYADSVMDEIIDSATKPLEGRRWWLKSDDPWQCLATCIEIHNAIKSGNPELFISHLPIHQDGTCNGLQHYAALGGDIYGAKSVNVLPSDSPQDVYSEVLSLVQARVNADAANKIPIALLLVDKLQRKIIKQTVMTSVYGVTFIGARKQIENAIKDKYPTFPEDKLFEATSYITRLTFDSLKEMFTGAKDIMSWLAKSANLISKQGYFVNWETPLGLPINQAYKKCKKNQLIETSKARLRVVTKDMIPVHTRRQTTAFPPNFVHSLDSTHMLLTALECNKRSITFGSVHDSFWSHACSIDEMNVILRKQFYDLHSRPLLENLLNFWKHKYPDIKFPDLPKRGDLDLKEVMNSTYFFS